MNTGTLNRDNVIRHPKRWPAFPSFEGHRNLVLHSSHDFPDSAFPVSAEIENATTPIYFSIPSGYPISSWSEWIDWDDKPGKLASIWKIRTEEEKTDFDVRHYRLLRLLQNITVKPFDPNCQNIHHKLEEVFNECSKKNWDGYDADPILKEAFEEIKEALNYLPQNTPLPEIVPEPSGEIGLEWRNRESGFLISFGGTGIITFAGIFGENDEVHGITKLTFPLPNNIIQNISRLFQ